MSDDDYKVGYGKPPKHSQFPPGTSGNKGRRKKVPENHREILGRLRDEKVSYGEQEITKFELAMRSTINQTIKGGKVRDLKTLLELFEKYGALPEVDRHAEAEAGAAKVMAKIQSIMHRTYGIDPEDATAVARDGEEEAKLVIACPSCGPTLKERWKDPDRKARKKRYGGTGLQNQVDKLFEAKARPG